MGLKEVMLICWRCRLEFDGGVRMVLQHRQLHRLFISILCTAIILTVLCLYSFHATLCVARLLSWRCISTVRSYP